METSCTVRQALTAQNITAQICQVRVRDKTAEIQVVGPVLCALATLAVIIRVIARRPIKTDLFGWDDCAIIFAVFFADALGISHWYLGSHGLGRDIWTVSFKDITAMLRLFYLGEIFYLISAAVTKIAILIFYLRVFTSQRFKQVTRVLIVLNALALIAWFFPVVFQCKPVRYAWTRWDGESGGSCIDLNAGTWTHATFNIVMDVVVLILPLPELAKLLTTYTIWWKVRVMVMFSFGLIVTIVSILRLRTLIVFANTHNPTWDYLGAAIWSVVEISVAIICACLPMTKLFFTRMLPQWLGFSVKASNYGHTPSGRAATARFTIDNGSGPGTANRLSKPGDRTSVVVSGRTRGEFVQLADVESRDWVEFDRERPR